ncbi:Compactin diketide synthase [Alternaria alternata]|nr:Compactin diketide synthase [Alternaria alternata]
MLNLSDGISFDTFLALMSSSQKACADTASPGNFIFMPMMAMGVVLSVAMVAIYNLCNSLSPIASRYCVKVGGALFETVADTRRSGDSIRFICYTNIDESILNN